MQKGILTNFYVLFVHSNIPGIKVNPGGFTHGCADYMGGLMKYVEVAHYM